MAWDRTVNAMKPLLSVENLTKRFGTFTANDAISLEVLPGERLAVLGENGAGKSTMMRMLAGELAPDGGRILWHGEPVKWRSAREAQTSGIGMVHQHFLLVGPLTAAENIGLGFEPRKGISLDRRALAERVRALGEQSGLVVDPDTPVEEMSVAAQQKVEILKALYRDVELLILDEPTASLAPQECADLLTNLRKLSDQGLTLLFVSHKLPEVMELCTRVAVLRAGKLVAVRNTNETSIEELAGLLVGRTDGLEKAEVVALGLSDDVSTTVHQEGRFALEIRNLHVRAASHETDVQGVTLELHEGEILGIAGVDGNGQGPLADALVGLRPVHSGAVTLAGKDITNLETSQRYRSGLAYLPEDRHRQGMALDFSLAENLALGMHNRPPYARGIALATDVLERDADTVVEEFGVRTSREPGSGAARCSARSLSGGNQQKFLFGREIGRDPKVLIAYQPTRGLDIGATGMLHDRLRAEAKKGRAILLISFDLDEVLSLSDRIAVMYKGAIAATLNRGDATREGLGRLMVGGASDA
jgi:simple sugar transport system ATP-binding protein